MAAVVTDRRSGTSSASDSEPHGWSISVQMKLNGEYCATNQMLNDSGNERTINSSLAHHVYLRHGLIIGPFDGG